MTTIEERVRSILENVKIEAQSWDAMNGYSMRPNRKTDYIGETTTELLSLITDEKLMENVKALHLPIFETTQIDYSVVELSRQMLLDHIAELKDQRRGE